MNSPLVTLARLARMDTSHQANGARRIRMSREYPASNDRHLYPGTKWIATRQGYQGERPAHPDGVFPGGMHTTVLLRRRGPRSQTTIPLGDSELTVSSTSLFS